MRVNTGNPLGDESDYKFTLMVQSLSLVLMMGISWMTVSLAGHSISMMALTGFGSALMVILYFLTSVLSWFLRVIYITSSLMAFLKKYVMGSLLDTPIWMVPSAVDWVISILDILLGLMVACCDTSSYLDYSSSFWFNFYRWWSLRVNCLDVVTKPAAPVNSISNTTYSG